MECTNYLECLLDSWSVLIAKNRMLVEYSMYSIDEHWCKKKVRSCHIKPLTAVPLPRLTHQNNAFLKANKIKVFVSIKTRFYLLN